MPSPLGNAEGLINPYPHSHPMPNLAEVVYKDDAGYIIISNKPEGLDEDIEAIARILGTTVTEATLDDAVKVLTMYSPFRAWRVIIITRYRDGTLTSFVGRLGGIAVGVTERYFYIISVHERLVLRVERDGDVMLRLPMPVPVALG
ncbi:hypothetical protein GCM10007112_23860 [Vulcanisaeta souniana JCM 11219]|uniref:Uncharacterized protein n=2 Tax=Vulcanisaeta souniana JCM 11219 TaxID=1293586 RepID=A0A830E629_9CREN|nr:hypothetical protein GCM10007112_23860 [Vulcanisaeta souniana JCM 11219]